MQYIFSYYLQRQILSFAGNLFKQFGPRSGTANTGPDQDLNCLTLMVFLKEFFKKKLILKKKTDYNKSMQNFPGGRVKSHAGASAWARSLHYSWSFLLHRYFV